MAKKYIIRKPNGETVSEDKRVRKKEKPVSRTCGECGLIIPSEKYLSVVDNKPLLGTCPYIEHLRLLSENACQHFEEIENN